MGFIVSAEMTKLKSNMCLKNLTILFYIKWETTGHLDVHLAKSLTRGYLDKELLADSALMTSNPQLNII